MKNPKIILNKTILFTEKYRGTSKFPFWQKIDTGKKIIISLDLSCYFRDYKPTCILSFVDEDLKFECSIARLKNYLFNTTYEIL